MKLFTILLALTFIASCTTTPISPERAKEIRELRLQKKLQTQGSN